MTALSASSGYGRTVKFMWKIKTLTAIPYGVPKAAQRRRTTAGPALVLTTMLAGVTGCSFTTGSTPPAASPQSPTAPHTPRHDRRITGQVTAENGPTWTVVNREGRQFTVQITNQTRFGSKQKPATVQQFPVGSEVRVAGALNGTTVTASRVATAAPKPQASPPQSAPNQG